MAFLLKLRSCAAETRLVGNEILKKRNDKQRRAMVKRQSAKWRKMENSNKIKAKTGAKAAFFGKLRSRVEDTRKVVNKILKKRNDKQRHAMIKKQDAKWKLKMETGSKIKAKTRLEICGIEKKFKKVEKENRRRWKDEKKKIAKEERKQEKERRKAIKLAESFLMKVGQDGEKMDQADSEAETRLKQGPIARCANRLRSFWKKRKG